jgi:hypothetical protein
VTDVLRLRTRTMFVKQTESKLEAKQDHCKLPSHSSQPPLTTLTDRKVVEAFETAMRLLAVP